MHRERSLFEECARGENRDPLSGAPGSHPLGTAVGAALGGVAGWAVAAGYGPLGAAFAAIAGALAGAAAGRAAAERMNPTAEDAVWRNAFLTGARGRAGGAVAGGFTKAPRARPAWPISLNARRGLAICGGEPTLETTPLDFW